MRPFFKCDKKIILTNWSKFLRAHPGFTVFDPGLCLICMFSYRIKRMAECGLLLRFEEIHQLPTNCSAKTTRTTSSQALSLEDILAPIFMIGIGMASATFVLGIEVTYHCLLEPLLKRHRLMFFAH